MIRNATSRDAQSIAAIYNFYVVNTTVTFEETELAAAEIAARIEAVDNAGYPWLAFEREGAVLGYAYAGGFAARSAYRLTAEATVYVAPDARGAGVGTELYRELIERLRAKRAHCVIGIIALPNEPSVRLHEKLGFVKVADLKEIGSKFGRWIDVGYWQLFL